MSEKKGKAVTDEAAERVAKMRKLQQGEFRITTTLVQFITKKDRETLRHAVQDVSYVHLIDNDTEARLVIADSRLGEITCHVFKVRRGHLGCAYILAVPR